jgi:hypothetical protein
MDFVRRMTWGLPFHCSMRCIWVTNTLMHSRIFPVVKLSVCVYVRDCMFVFFGLSLAAHAWLLNWLVKILNNVHICLWLLTMLWKCNKTFTASLMAIVSANVTYQKKKNGYSLCSSSNPSSMQPSFTPFSSSTSKCPSSKAPIDRPQIPQIIPTQQLFFEFFLTNQMVHLLHRYDIQL